MSLPLRWSIFNVEALDYKYKNLDTCDHDLHPASHVFLGLGY